MLTGPFQEPWFEVFKKIEGDGRWRALAGAPEEQTCIKNWLHKTKYILKSRLEEEIRIKNKVERANIYLKKALK